MRFHKLILASSLFLIGSAQASSISHIHLDKQKPLKVLTMTHLDKYRNNEKLDLSNSDLKDDDITFLVKYLQNHPNITSLNLAGDNLLTAAGYVQLANVPTIKELDLTKTSRTCRGDECEGTLTDTNMAIFSKNTTLTALNLDLHNIHDAGALSLSKNHTIKKLNINNNFVTDVGAVALLTTGKLEELNLVENDVTLASAVAASKSPTLKKLSIRVHKEPDKIAAILATSQTLEDIEIFWITDTGAEILSKDAKLRRLKVPGTLMSAKGVRALSANTTLLALYLDGCHCSGVIPLDDEAAIALANNKTLQELGLSVHHITSKGAIALSKMTQLQYLDLFDNKKIQDDAAIAFRKNLKNLKYLDVSSTGISNVGLIELSEMPSLNTLHIAINNIGDAGAIALSKNTTLSEIDLYRNHITDEGALAFTHVQTLHTLDLYHNELSNVAKIALKNNLYIKKLLV